MSGAINLSLDLLEKRKGEYEARGVTSYKPWLVLMTDGEPIESNEEVAKSIKRTTELLGQKRLTIFPVGIGEEVNMKILKKYSPYRTPLKIRDAQFKDFFSWLT